MKTALFAILALTSFASFSHADEILNDRYVMCGDWTYDTLNPAIELARFQTPTMRKPSWAFSYATKRLIHTDHDSYLMDNTSCVVQTVEAKDGAYLLKGENCSAIVKGNSVTYMDKPTMGACSIDGDLTMIMNLLSDDLKAI